MLVRMYGERVVAWTAVLGLAAWAFWHRFSFLAQSPYPLGVDGYFYAVQLRALLADGALYYSQPPLAFWLMAPLAALTDPVTGAKLGAAAAGALLVVPVYLLGRRIGGNRPAGVLAAALVASSPSGSFTATEFVKNSFGLAVLAWFLAALGRALDGPTRGRVALAAGALVACVLTHKLAAVLALVAGVPALLASPRVRPYARRIAIGAGLAAAAWLAVTAVAPARIADAVPGARDLALVGELFDWQRPDWRVPALGTRSGEALWFGHEAALAAALAVIAAAWAITRALTRRRQARRESSTTREAPGSASPESASARAATDRPALPASHDRAVALALAAVALVAGLPWLDASEPQGLAFRLRVIAYLPLALTAALLAGALTRAAARSLARRHGSHPGLSRWAPRAPALLLVPFAAGLVIARAAPSDEGVVRTHPAMQAAVRAVAGLVPERDVVIAPERHIVFMVVWYARTPARLRPEPVPAERRWRLLPLAHIDAALAAAIERARVSPPPGLERPRGLHPSREDGLVLMPEATWQWVLGQLPPGSRAHYERWVTI